MKQTTVVNQKFTSADVFIGRAPGEKGIFGNPFASKPTSIPHTIQVESDTLACALYRAWLTGSDPGLFNKHTSSSWRGWQRQRRQDILTNIYRLSGKSLGCFCVTPRNKTPDCHGFILAELADLQALAMAWRDARTPGVWTFPQIQARAWLDQVDVWPVADGYMVQPWTIQDSPIDESGKSEINKPARFVANTNDLVKEFDTAN